jgi:hypothetical protein
MSAFKRLPMDVVKHILPYDSRFVIRKGEIIQINKLDMNKCKTAALNLLLFFKKPKIICELRYNKVTFWSSVRFSNGKGICYSMGRDWCKNHLKDHVVYSYGRAFPLSHCHDLVINYPLT